MPLESGMKGTVRLAFVGERRGGLGVLVAHEIERVFGVLILGTVVGLCSLDVRLDRHQRLLRSRHRRCYEMLAQRLIYGLTVVTWDLH